LQIPSRMTRTRIAATTLLLLLVASPASAQDWSLVVGARGGAVVPLHGQVSDARSWGGAGGVSVAGWHPSGFSPRLDLAYRALGDAPNDGVHHASGLLHASVGLRWYAPGWGRVAPFVGANAGVVAAFTGASTSEARPPDARVTGARSVAMAVGGALGLDVALLPWLSFEVEARYDYVPPEEDGFYFPQLPGGGLLGVSAGVNFRF